MGGEDDPFRVGAIADWSKAFVLLVHLGKDISNKQFLWPAATPFIKAALVEALISMNVNMHGEEGMETEAQYCHNMLTVHAVPIPELLPNKCLEGVGF